jgi:hypothetical protein
MNSRKNSNKNKQTRRSSQSANQLLHNMLTQRNVRYIQGTPKFGFNHERVYEMWITSTTIFNIMSSGAVGQAQSLDPTQRITNFSTMWAKLFQQYCVLEIRVDSKMRVLNAAATGQLNVFLSEDSSTPNNLSLSREHAVLDLNTYAQGDDKRATCQAIWTPASAEDWTWTAITVSQNLVYLKVYGDAGNTGTNTADSTSQYMANLTYRIAFRYYF